MRSRGFQIWYTQCTQLKWAQHNCTLSVSHLTCTSCTLPLLSLSSSADQHFMESEIFLMFIPLFYCLFSIQLSLWWTAVSFKSENFYTAFIYPLLLFRHIWCLAVLPTQLSQNIFSFVKDCSYIFKVNVKFASTTCKAFMALKSLQSSMRSIIKHFIHKHTLHTIYSRW